VLKPTLTCCDGRRDTEDRGHGRMFAEGLFKHRIHVSVQGSKRRVKNVSALTDFQRHPSEDRAATTRQYQLVAPQRSLLGDGRTFGGGLSRQACWLNRSNSVKHHLPLDGVPETARPCLVLPLRTVTPSRATVVFQWEHWRCVVGKRCPRMTDR
jgi:hypothetical protein